MGRLSDLQPLMAQHDYAGAKTLLLSLLHTARGNERIYVLTNLVTLFRRLIHVKAAENCMNEAEFMAKNMGPGFPSEHWLSMAAFWESLGYPNKAKDILERLSTKAHSQRHMECRYKRVDYAARVENFFSGYNFKVLALGQDCLPDDIATRWGLNGIRVDGPFTAGMFSSDGAAMALEDDFTLFYQKESFKIQLTARGYHSATLPGYHVCFSQQVGDWWVENDCQRIRNLYASRIEAFRSALLSDAVLCICCRIESMDIVRLYRALQKYLRPGARIHLLVIDYLKDRKDDLSGLENVSITPADYPAPGYVWHQREHYDTPGGLQMEERIVKSIMIEIKKVLAIEST